MWNSIKAPFLVFSIHNYVLLMNELIHFVNRKINCFRGLVRYSLKLLTKKFPAKGI